MKDFRVRFVELLFENFDKFPDFKIESEDGWIRKQTTQQNGKRLDLLDIKCGSEWREISKLEGGQYKNIV